jgi:hypothetical protein
MQQRSPKVKDIPAKVANKVAGVVGIDDKLRKRFHKRLSSIVRGAWRGHAVNRKVPRQSDVTKHLDRLRRALTALLPQREGPPRWSEQKKQWRPGKLLPSGAGEAAGIILEATIAPDTIEDWIEKVERAKFNATENPKTKLLTKGVPKGTRGKPAFGVFLAQMLTAEEIFGFKWTIGSNQYREGVEGSLIDALNALTNYLPPDFTPNPQTLRRSVSQMRKRLERK